MARPGTLAMRQALVARLKTAGNLTVLVPSASIHRQASPARAAWPFVRTGAPIAVPLTGACLDGKDFTIAVHGFSKGRYAADSELECAEDHAMRIGDEIAVALDHVKIDLAGIGAMRVRWTGGQTMPDGAEAGAFHTVQNFRVRVLS